MRVRGCPVGVDQAHRYFDDPYLHVRSFRHHHRAHQSQVPRDRGPRGLSIASLARLAHGPDGRRFVSIRCSCVPAGARFRATPARSGPRLQCNDAAPGRGTTPICRVLRTLFRVRRERVECLSDYAPGPERIRDLWLTRANQGSSSLLPKMPSRRTRN